LSSGALGPVQALTDAHRLDDFNCGVVVLDRWLRQSARVAAASGTAATYVLCRDERVVGYHALAMSAVAHEMAPSRLRRGMPDPVPVVLLARLALDRSEQGRSLGGHLLVDALARCVRGGSEYGARAVVVDALSHEAGDFYRHFGFHDLDDRRLWRRLTDIARALADQAMTREEALAMQGAHAIAELPAEDPSEQPEHPAGLMHEVEQRLGDDAEEDGGRRGEHGDEGNLGL
jgi:GNAT superfamily N-acetyltransferase